MNSAIAKGLLLLLLVGLPLKLLEPQAVHSGGLWDLLGVISALVMRAFRLILNTLTAVFG
jgi:hypothetical protein